LIQLNSQIAQASTAAKWRMPRPQLIRIKIGAGASP